MELFAWPHELSQWSAVLAQMLDARTSGRLGPVFWGLLFSHGRRTVAAWLRGAGESREFRHYYYFLGSIGRKTEDLAARLLGIVRQRLAPADRILLGIDDTPTKRFGPKVQGAGIHHNPTPGPAGAKFLYGHVWVTLAWLVRHPAWGAIALPLLAKLYVRAQDVLRMPRRNRVPFRTKLEQAAELIEWAQQCLAWTGIPVWCVADGASAKRPSLKRALAAGVVVVSRLRHNAALFDLPPEPQPGQRGRPRKYGRNRIRLARCAARRQGWQTADFVLYGKSVTKTYQTFLATWQPAGGVIRVVLVQEEHGRTAFFATNPEASVQDILEAVSDRFALEQVFHDVKEIHGAGQQQLRSVWANIAAYHLILWMHTLTELWAWTQSHGDLCDRSDSPWDDPARRPSDNIALDVFGLAILRFLVRGSNLTKNPPPQPTPCQSLDLNLTACYFRSSSRFLPKRAREAACRRYWIAQKQDTTTAVHAQPASHVISSQFRFAAILSDVQIASWLLNSLRNVRGVQRDRSDSYSASIFSSINMLPTTARFHRSGASTT